MSDFRFSRCRRVWLLRWFCVGLFAGCTWGQVARALSNDSVFWRDGKPLAGGWVYTYNAGGNIPTPTFNDSDARIPNPNPVILDYRGTAKIFLRRGWAYRIRVCDSLLLRCEIYRDNIVGQLTPWHWSAASLAAAQVADAASSWRLQERNPLLRSGSGEFGYKGAAIKGATAAGMLLLEARFIRRHPDLARPFTVLNFVAAGVTSGIAVRNWRLR